MIRILFLDLSLQILMNLLWCLNSFLMNSGEIMKMGR